MADELQELMDGTTGHFWTEIGAVLNLEEAANGHVELKDDALFHIETLTSLELVRSLYASSTATREIPRAIYGSTKPAGAVFYDIAGLSSNNIIGGVRASSAAYRVRSVLCGVNLRNVASDKLTRMLVTFPKVMFWSGIGGVSTTVGKDEFGRSQSVDAKLRSAKAISAPVRRGIKISFSSHWSITGPDDVRVLKNPLAVITESAKPKEWWDHLEPILAVQDLINMAFQGFVVADVGTADIEVKQEDPHARSSELWISRLMTVPPSSTAPESMNEIPVFNLLQIGGIRGVDGWIELTRKYGRATGPISKIYRFGSGLAAETRCMEIAAAIDYWSEIHRRSGAGWADRTNGTLTEVRAKFVGTAFTEFVGDIKVWSKIFRDTYNRIKHEPVFSYDGEDVYTITRSAEILLQSALLNRIARNKKMTHIICDSHRNYDVGIEVRKIVARGHL
jgi:ApeA N-terminal domain 1